MSTDKRKRIQIMTHFLYARMPGAEQPPMDERGKLWGEVDHTEHYAFCEAIAELIERVDVRTHVNPD